MWTRIDDKTAIGSGRCRRLFPVRIDEGLFEVVRKVTEKRSGGPEGIGENIRNGFAADAAPSGR